MENEIFLKTSKLGFAKEQTLEDVTKEIASQFQRNIQESIDQIQEKKLEKNLEEQEHRKAREQIEEVQTSSLTKVQKEWLVSYLEMDSRKKKLALASLEVPKDKEILPWIIKFSKNADSCRSFASYAKKLLKDGNKS